MHTLKLRDPHTFMYSQNYQWINSHPWKIGEANFLKFEHCSKQRQHSGRRRVPTETWAGNHCWQLLLPQQDFEAWSPGCTMSPAQKPCWSHPERQRPWLLKQTLLHFKVSGFQSRTFDALKILFCISQQPLCKWVEKSCACQLALPMPYLQSLLGRSPHHWSLQWLTLAIG